MDPERRYASSTGRTVNKDAPRLLVLTALAVSVVLVACEREPEPVGEHVEFIFENTSRRLCAGSVPHMNHYVERVFEFFEESVPDDFSVPVRVVQMTPCGEHEGCYRPSEEAIYIEALDKALDRTGGVLRHELSHAVIDRVWGESVPFFEEGLAESLSRTYAWSLGSSEAAPVSGMLDGESGGLDYVAAARFVRFLIDTRGISRFKQMFQAASDRTQDSIRMTFMDVYGEDFETLEAEYLSGAPRCTFQVDICDEEKAERVGSSWSLTFAASCDDPDFYGSIGKEDQTIATQRTVLVESAGSYHLSSSSPVLLARCGDCDQQFTPTLLLGDTDIELEEGLYTLEFTLTKDAVVTFALVSETVDP